MGWTPDPLEPGTSIVQAGILDLCELLRGMREQADPRSYQAFLEIGLCRWTSEWRHALDSAEDDPRAAA